MAHAAAAAQLREAPSWPGCLSPALAGALPGVLARELLTPAQLTQEAVDLGHCVAGYTTACYRGRSRIVSLTCSATGARSTVELVRAERDPKKLEIRQHYARHNTNPEPKLERGAEILLRELNRAPVAAWPVMPDLTPTAQWEQIHAHMGPWLRRYLGVREASLGPAVLAA